MTLDECISRIEDELKSPEWENTRCKEDHKQLLDWLLELKQLRRKAKQRFKRDVE